MMTDENTSPANLVSEVLANASRLEKEDLNAKLGQLSKKIIQVKEEVYESLQALYSDSDPCFEMTGDLHKRVNVMKEEISTLENKISKDIKGQLNISTTELQDLSGQLQVASCTALVLERLMMIHGCLDDATTAIHDKQYYKAADSVMQMKKLLDSPMDDKESKILIMKPLRVASKDAFVKLKLETENSWANCIKWHLPVKDSENRTTEVTIPVGNDKSDLFHGTAQSMEKLGILEDKLQVLGQRFMKHVVNPIINSRCSVQLSSNYTKRTLAITVSKDSVKPDVTDIADNLKKAFSFFYDGAFCKTVTRSEKEVTLMSLLGQHIGQEFLEMFIKLCLSRLIPSSRSELANFNTVKKQPLDFQRFLIRVKFIPETDTQITAYVDSVDTLFANKKSQEILDKSRNLMKADMHNAVKVEEDGAVVFPGMTKKDNKTNVNKALVDNKYLDASTFKFPVCMISSSVRDLMNLVYETLYEAAVSSPTTVIQMHYVMRRVFNMFLSVVPTYHKDNLASLPHLAALHHNNCMYIAHHLVTLGHQFSCHLTSDLNTTVGDADDQPQVAMTYVDLVPSIKRLGVECFLQMMTLQKNQMIECLHQAQGFQGVSQDSQFQNADRALKQSLYQLNRLSNIWKDVLPSVVYNKSMGTLLKSLITEITSSIVSLEDISADDATMLHSLTQTVVDKVPALLLPLDGVEVVSLAEIYQFVSNWNKFQELQRLLDASLQEIADRWADGKGPLATEFTSNEVKQLIRALFQNTDRRAAVLSKIQ